MCPGSARAPLAQGSTLGWTLRLKTQTQSSDFVLRAFAKKEVNDNYEL